MFFYCVLNVRKVGYENDTSDVINSLMVWIFSIFVSEPRKISPFNPQLYIHVVPVIMNFFFSAVETVQLTEESKLIVILLRDRINPLAQEFSLKF